MKIIKTVDEFKELINANSKVVIDFFATWCGPCKMISPIIEQVSEEISDVAFVKVDVDQAEELASLFQITSIPTIAYIKDKTVLLRELGFQQKDHIIQNIKDILK